MSYRPDEQRRLAGYAEMVRKDPGELLKLSPDLQHKVARFMTPEAKPAAYVAPHYPNIEFDNILKMETENPDGYHEAVSGFNPITRLSFTRYRETKTANGL